ncbi:MAG TPA: S41 family peptidase [Saprospiraceae bacterium]|nr:S41 family peptidase [Saprospiraceae bacterium]HMP24238.1 S41 family peptidase [Saprospiraceae bacterium]
MNKRLTLLFLLGLLYHQCPGQPTSLSKQQATQDVEFFVKTLEAKHPNPTANFPNYRAYKDSLIASFSASIASEDFAKTICLYANLFQDGHTFASNMKIPDTAQVLPFDVAMKNNRFFILNSLHKDFSTEYKGAEIIGINGTSIRDVINLAMPFAGGETEAHQLARLAYSFAGFVYRVMGEITEVNLQQEGKHVSIRPPLIDRAQWLQKSISTNRPVFDYQNIDEKTSLILFTDMSNLSKKEFSQFLDKTFQGIKNSNTENLIIDLRHNGGGNFLYGQMLLAYLTDKPYTVHNKYQYDMDGKKTNPKMFEIKPENQKNRFVGNVYFLTSPYTYSSAASMIAAVKFNKIGQIIGTPIGQPYAGFIDMTTFTLPNSKLLCGTSTVYYEYAGATDSNKNLGIEPDVDTAEDALSYVLDKLK